MSTVATETRADLKRIDRLLKRSYESTCKDDRATAAKLFLKLAVFACKYGSVEHLNYLATAAGLVAKRTELEQ